MITKISCFNATLVAFTVLSDGSSAINLSSQGNWLTSMIGWEDTPEIDALTLSQQSQVDLNDLSVIEKENSLAVTQDLKTLTKALMPEPLKEVEAKEKPKAVERPTDNVKKNSHVPEAPHI